MNPLYVGIDVSSKNNVAYLMKSDGSKHSSFSVQNNRGGAKLLSEKIVSAMGTMGLSDVVIGMEATSIYGDGLVCALREDGSLGRFQRKIHVLNPKQVRKFKEAYPDLPKNDWVDAFVIADHLRFGRIGKEVCLHGRLPLQSLTNPDQSQIRRRTGPDAGKAAVRQLLIHEMLRNGSGQGHLQLKRYHHCPDGAV